jgi:hypothetical protein
MSERGLFSNFTMLSLKVLPLFMLEKKVQTKEKNGLMRHLSAKKIWNSTELQKYVVCTVHTSL